MPEKNINIVLVDIDWTLFFQFVAPTSTTPPFKAKAIYNQELIALLKQISSKYAGECEIYLFTYYLCNQVQKDLTLAIDLTATRFDIKQHLEKQGITIAGIILLGDSIAHKFTSDTAPGAYAEEFLRPIEEKYREQIELMKQYADPNSSETSETDYTLFEFIPTSKANLSSPQSIKFLDFVQQEYQNLLEHITTSIPKPNCAQPKFYEFNGKDVMLYTLLDYKRVTENTKIILFEDDARHIKACNDFMQIFYPEIAFHAVQISNNFKQFLRSKAEPNHEANAVKHPKFYNRQNGLSLLDAVSQYLPSLQSLWQNLAIDDSLPALLTQFNLATAAEQNSEIEAIVKAEFNKTETPPTNTTLTYNPMEV